MEIRTTRLAAILRFLAASIIAAAAAGACNDFSGPTDVTSPGKLTPVFANDVTAPTVAIISPLNGATGVANNKSVIVQFSETMNLGTINSSSFTVAPSGGSPIAGAISFHSQNYVAFDAASPMAAGTTYVVTINSGAKDVAGNGLSPVFTSTFTIAGTLDNTPPTITNVSPVNSATGVATNSSVVVTFSEPMSAATVSASTFTLSPTAGGGAVVATVSYNSGNGTATLTPSSALANSTGYTVNVTAGAKDVTGNGLTPFSSTFTTAAVADLTSPTVTNVIPANNATTIATNSTVVVTFSEQMSPATVSASTFTLSPTSGGGAIAATVSYNSGNTTATLTPSSGLANSTGYTVNVTSGAKDAANNGLTPFSSTFTTAAPADITPPTITNVVPANNATAIATNSKVVVTFSEAMSAASITNSTFTLSPTSGGGPIAASVLYNGGAGTATLTPSSALANSTSYTVNLTSGAKDVANNGLTPFTSSFTTVAAGDVTPPTVSMLSPVGGATGVATNAGMIFKFNETMNLSTITGASVTLAPVGGGAGVPGTLSFHSQNAVLFQPNAPLGGGTTYLFTVNSGAKDLSGNGVTPDFTITFTTIGAADNTAPTVTNVVPANAASNVATSSTVVVTFSEAMSGATITTSTVTLSPTSGGGPLAATVTYNAGALTATLTPSSQLTSSTSYTVNVTGGAKDVANNSLTPFSSTFTTAAAADLTPPTVTSVAPLNNASNVATSSNVVVTFSEAMSAATVNTSTFTLTPTSGGSPVAASVIYNAGSATLTPSSALSNSTSYTVNLTSGAKDLANNGLTAFSSAFTTVAPADITPPTITNVIPANNASGVATNSNVVVTFSEAMSAATISPSTVTLTPTSGGSPIAATVSYNSGTATLTPSSPLSSSTIYTVTVTPGVQDLAGNSLSSQFSSTFTTAGPADVTPPTVTNVVPGNSATAIATNSKVVVTFSEAMSPATVNTSTFTLTPTSGGAPVAATVNYSAGSATLTPSSLLANAKSYTVNVTSGAKDLANNGLTAFTSSFTTVAAGDVTPPTVVVLTPASGATGVATNAGVIFRFNETMNLGTITGTSVTLAPFGGGPGVPGTLSFHSQNTALFQPNALLAAGTTYVFTVNNGAKDLAGNGVTPDFTSTFTTAGVVDNTPPTVTNVVPANSASNVAVSSSVIVTFSEAMSAASITTSTFTLSPTSGGGAVAANVSYNSGAGTATLTPTSALAYSTGYTVNVTSGAKDLANNALTAFSSSFTTGAAPDITPPTVTAVTPLNSTNNVAISSNVVVTFSEAMSAATVNTSTFTLTPTSGGSPVAANVVYSAGSATLTPTSALSYSTSYTVNVTNSAKDLANNSLTAFNSTFTTAAAPDITPPTVTAITPLNSATGVAITSNVVATFSEAMDAVTVNSSTFTLTPTSGGSPVAANVNYSAGSATLTPTSALAYSANYTVNVTSGAKDLANNGLTAFTSTFTTAAAPDITPPTVASVTPLNGASTVAVNSAVSVTFSESMNAGTVTTSTFTLTPTSGGSPVAANVNYSAGSATLTPTSALAFSTSYTVNVTSGAKDLANNGLTAFTSNFTTAGAPDITSPTVTSVTPLNGASNVAVNSAVSVTFSEAMNAGTVTTSTFTLTPTSGGSPVAANVVYSAGSATLTPTSALAYSTNYTVNVTSGAKDLANNGLTAFSSTFTTAAAPDITPPTVTAVTPLNSAAGVAITSIVVATFSEAMSAATVNTSTFTLTPTSGGSPVAANVNYSAGSATLTPTSALAYSTNYTVNVTSGAKDLANNGLTAFSSTFTTAAAPDITPPTVTAVTPLNAATGVAITSNVVATFSEAMSAVTVNTSTFTLTPTSGGSPVAANVVYSAGSATLTPTSSLAYSTSYTVNVTSGAKDLANNGLTAFSSTFTTAAAPDLTPPTVTGVAPVNAATNVAVNSSVVVTFSEAMSAASITTSTFTLSPTSGGGAVAATVSYNSGAGTATLTPSSVLAYSTNYTVNVTSGAKDLANNGLTAFSSTFTTTAPPDLTPPTVTNVSPANSATNVAVGSSVSVTFSEAMNAATISTGTFTVSPTSGGGAVAATLVYSAGTRIATLTPTSPLAYSTNYTVSATNSITDAAGNGLTAFSSTFTTVAPPDVTPPTVTSVTPANNATNVALNTNVIVNFSESMVQSTINSTNLTLTPTSGGSAVAATISYNVASKFATIAPTSPLAYGTNYTVNVSSGAKDLANNGLTAFSSNFTTVPPPDVTPPTIVSVSPVDRSVDNSTTAQARVTFSEPINPATITSSTFAVREFLPSGPFIAGTRTYEPATNTVVFTPTSPYLNHRSYEIHVNPGLKDVAGNSVTSATMTCFTPTAGNGAVTTMNGFWGGNTACAEVHWHIQMIQTGNTLSLGTCTQTFCTSYAVTEAGRADLGGATCRPTNAGGPTLCELNVVSLTGSVSGQTVTFTFTMENGLTFTFNGAFSQTGTANPFLTGTMSGATLTPIGTNFERELP